MANVGFTIWFTGLSGAGKSTLSEIIRKTPAGARTQCGDLDGDVVRTHLSKGLGLAARIAIRILSVSPLFVACSLAMV